MATEPTRPDLNQLETDCRHGLRLSEGIDPNDVLALIAYARRLEAREVEVEDRLRGIHERLLALLGEGDNRP